MLQNENLFRLALVVNTSHFKFVDNLADVIAYTIFASEDDGLILKEDDIAVAIEEKFELVFTDDEVKNAIREKEELFYISNNQSVTLTELGRKKIKPNQKDAFEHVVENYLEVKKSNHGSKEVVVLLNRYIYRCICTNIEALLSVINGKPAVETFGELDEFNNVERKLINDFIDWDNDEKNRILYKLVAFAVDYCRMTVKKDSRNFSTILQGKEFYLDSNIIFRLMGVNNEQRQNTIKRFITKCQESRILICYTTITRKEVIESIKHHIKSIKKCIQGYHGTGGGSASSYKNGVVSR